LLREITGKRVSQSYVQKRLIYPAIRTINKRGKRKSFFPQSEG
jgi:hypothetical protein